MTYHDLVLCGLIVLGCLVTVASIAISVRNLAALFAPGIPNWRRDWDRRVPFPPHEMAVELDRLEGAKQWQ